MMVAVQPPQLRFRLAVGVMTGTSIDGIDAALVRVEGSGLGIRAELIRHISRPLNDLGFVLRAAAGQKPMTAAQFAQLARDFGLLHADVIGELMATHARPDFICIHGQTIFHQPPISWQLINPAPIAQRFGCPVASDLRQADLAAGGQGAPITPIADWIMFRDSKKSRAIVNLGGFCNVTILPASSREVAATERAGEFEAIRGFDVCACNQILDEVARQALGKPFDEGGMAASRGQTMPQAAAALHSILSHQHIGSRSLGTGDEAHGWIRDHIDKMSPDDLAASAVNAVARCMSDALKNENADEAIIAGGGARNLALIAGIRKTTSISIHLSDQFGVPIDARESMAMAILGALCADGVPITLPQVTGCRAPAPVAGVWSMASGTEDRHRADTSD